MTRDEAIARVQKLRAMTEANGCSEAEAALAFAKLQQLMLDWDLTQDETSIRQDAAGCIEDSFRYFGATRAEWSRCAAPIAKLYHCRYYHKRTVEDPLGLGQFQPIWNIRFFGFKLDVEAAITMVSIVATAIETEARRQRGHKAVKESYAMGMAARLIERIEAMLPPPAAVSGTALIVLKDQLVTDEWRKHCAAQGLKFRQSSWTGPADAAAFARGYASGGNVDLGTGGRLYGQRQIEH